MTLFVTEIMRTFFYICVLLLSSVQAAEADISIVAKPNRITIGQTKSLTVNCTYLYQGLSSFHIVSLVVEAIENRTALEVASINVYSDGVVSNLDHENFTSWGQLDPAGSSYLAVRWNYPSTKESRVYKCEAHGVDLTGHPEDSVSKTAEVTHEPVDVTTLTEIIRKFQLRADDLEKQNALLTKTVATLQETVALRDQNDSNFNLSLIVLQEQMQYLTQVVSSGACSCTSNSTGPPSTNTSGSTTLAPEATSPSRTELLQLLVHISNTSYYISSEKYSNFSESSRICSEHRGYLAKIDDEYEMDSLVSAFINSDYYREGFLTGAKLRLIDNKWIYESDGSEMEFEDWDIGEPDQDENECMAIFQRPEWKMIDFPCENMYHSTDGYYNLAFICEIRDE